jgi:hypothetical protein
MLLMLNLFFILVTLYRGWFLEVFFVVLVALTLHYFCTYYQFHTEKAHFIIELSMLFLLIFLSALPKKSKLPKCPNCNEPITRDHFSCPTCGKALKNHTVVEDFKNNTHYVKKVLAKKELFFDVKDAIIDQYNKLGFTRVVVDEHNMLLLKHDRFTDSHVSVKLINYNLIIEACNTQKPEIDLN